MAAEIKVPQLTQQHSMAQVQVGRSGIEPGFDAQRAARFARLFQAVLQVFFPDDLGEALLQIRELFSNGGKRHSPIVGNRVKW